MSFPCFWRSGLNWNYCWVFEFPHISTVLLSSTFRQGLKTRKGNLFFILNYRHSCETRRNNKSFILWKCNWQDFVIFFRGNLKLYILDWPNGKDFRISMFEDCKHPDIWPDFWPDREICSEDFSWKAHLLRFSLVLSVLLVPDHNQSTLQYNSN